MFLTLYAFYQHSLSEKHSQYLLKWSQTSSLRFKRRETSSISSQTRFPPQGAADSSSLTVAAGTQSPIHTGGGPVPKETIKNGLTRRQARLH